MGMQWTATGVRRTASSSPAHHAWACRASARSPCAATAHRKATRAAIAATARRRTPYRRAVRGRTASSRVTAAAAQTCEGAVPAWPGKSRRYARLRRELRKRQRGGGGNCDDGNSADGDGCSRDCKVEPGFTCSPQTRSDVQNCMQAVNAGKQCLELPVLYRDFKNESVTPGGHPDFFYHGATVAKPVTMSGVAGLPGNSFDKRYCVPNTAGIAPLVNGGDTTALLGRSTDEPDAEASPSSTPCATAAVTTPLCECQPALECDTNNGAVTATATNSPPTVPNQDLGSGAMHPLQGQRADRARRHDLWPVVAKRQLRATVPWRVLPASAGSSSRRPAPISIGKQAIPLCGWLLSVRRRSGERLPMYQAMAPLRRVRPRLPHRHPRSVEREVPVQRLAVLVLERRLWRRKQLPGQAVHLPPTASAAACNNPPA